MNGNKGYPPYRYKEECHKLMVQIWGDSVSGKSLAYAWLRFTFGEIIHFSEIEDSLLLEKIYNKLVAYSVIQENISFLDQKRESYKREDKRKSTLKKKKHGRNHVKKRN